MPKCNIRQREKKYWKERGLLLENCIIATYTNPIECSLRKACLENQKLNEAEIKL